MFLEVMCTNLADELGHHLVGPPDCCDSMGNPHHNSLLFQRRWLNTGSLILKIPEMVELYEHLILII